MLLEIENSLRTTLMADATYPVDRVVLRGAVCIAGKVMDPSLPIWLKKEQAPKWISRRVKLTKEGWHRKHINKVFPHAWYRHLGLVKAWMQDAGLMELSSLDEWDLFLDVTRN
jgi:hypothetical protein